MKTKVFLLLIVIASITKQSFGQNDSTKQTKKSCENYYAPWHQDIKDTIHQTVSDFGGYFSAGIGGGSAYGMGGISTLLSASFAAKSFLLTVTRAGAFTFDAGGANNAISYQASYLGFLIGESVRFEHGMVSLSVGVASSNLTFHYRDINTNTYVFKYLNGIASFPIELKTFVYAHNGIGFGLHISKNFVNPSQFSPFYFGICIVGGYWNKHKK